MRLGIIGIGNIGTSHVKHLIAGECPEIDLAAVCDIKPDRLGWAKENLPESVARFDDAYAMMDSGLVDAVLVSVPRYDHPVFAKECFNRGLHVLVYELLAVLFEKYQDTRYVRHVAEGCLRQVIEYIADHYCEDIFSSGISEQFGYDESYFCRLFKSVIGVRPMEYIRILRLEKARRIMAREKTSISKVAVECGFSDVNYFTRCFRRHYGITAGEYRKKNNKIINRIRSVIFNKRKNTDKHIKRACRCFAWCSINPRRRSPCRGCRWRAPADRR